MRSRSRCCTSLSDLIEALQGGFSTGQLWLTLIAEAAIPVFVIGLYLVQRPRIGRLGKLSAFAYAYAYVFFTGTVVYALVDGTSDYTALSQDLQPWMTIHGAIMVLAGLGFGFAVIRARVLPAWTGVALMAGVVLVSLSQTMPEGPRCSPRRSATSGSPAWEPRCCRRSRMSATPASAPHGSAIPRAAGAGVTPPGAAPGATARRLVTGGIASLLLAAMLASPAPAATPPDRATLTRMDDVIRAGMDRSGMPGFAVAVVSGGDVVHARGFGDAGDGRGATPRTPFLLGSASKSFTALAAMQLVDAGRLDLDAAARRYVPEFRLADQSAADRITVRQVLQQTSGLPATAGGAVVRSAADGSTLDAVRELRDTTLATPPGAAFEYANANYILAGLIVERASGEPYGQYIQRHIFTPLGMRAQLRRARRCQARRTCDGAPLLVRPHRRPRADLPPRHPVRGLPHLVRR